MSEETGVVVKQENPVAEFLPKGFVGNEGAEERVSIPLFFVGQGSGKQTKEMAGKIVCKKNGEAYDEIVISLVRMNRIRTFFENDYNEDPDSMPRCKSLDGLTPDLAYFHNDRVKADMPVCPKCGDLIPSGGGKDFVPVCQMAKWTKDQRGNPVRPRCDDGRRLLLVDVERCVPLIFDLKGVSMSEPDPGDSYLSYMQLYNHLVMNWESGQIPFYMHKLTLRIGEKTSPKGVKYAARFEKFVDDAKQPVLLTHEDLTGIARMIGHLAKMTNETQREAEQAANETPPPQEYPDEEMPY